MHEITVYRDVETDIADTGKKGVDSGEKRLQFGKAQQLSPCGPPIAVAPAAFLACLSPVYCH